MNLLEGATAFARLAVLYEGEIAVALEDGCKIVEDEAKRVIGTYDYGWIPLKPETVARKATGDSPLLETGEMRESIEHTVVGHSGFVGTNSDIAVFQELGTSRIPPRSFLAGAAMRKGQEVADAVGGKIFTRMISD
jgi:phage gpG-like protein